MNDQSVFSKRGLGLRLKLILPLALLVLLGAFIVLKVEKISANSELERLGSVLVTSQLDLLSEGNFDRSSAEFVSKVLKNEFVSGVVVLADEPFRVVGEGKKDAQGFPLISENGESAKLGRNDFVGLPRERLQAGQVTHWDAEECVYVQPFTLDGGQVGSVYVQIDDSEILGRVNQVFRNLMILMLATCLLSYFLVSRFVLNPIRKIYEVIDGNSSGSLDTRLGNSEKDELGQLSRRVDRMFGLIDSMNQELRAILDALPAFVFYKDTENRIIRVNQNAADSLGLSVGEVEGKMSEEIFPKEDALAYFEDDKEVFSSGVPKIGIVENYEAYVGEISKVRTDKIPLFDHDGKCIGLVLIAVDVTSEFLKEQSLIESNDALKEALSKVDSFKKALDEHSLVSITDVKGTITYVNEKFCEVSKYSEAELTGQNHRLINSGTHSREFWKDLWATILSGNVWRGEICNRNKEGELYWVESTIVPFKDAAGKITDLVAVRTEISETKRVEKELLRTSMLLERTNAVATIGAWELDLVNQNLYWSSTTKKIHEVDDDFEPTLGEAVEFYKEGDNRDRLIKEIDQVIKNGGTWDLTLQIVTAKKRELWVRAIGEAEIVNGECIRLYGTFQDVDAQVKAKRELELYSESLRETSERLALAAKAGGFGIWSWDIKNNRVVWDHQMFALYGIEQEYSALAYEVWNNGLHPSDREQADKEVQMALSGEKDFDTKFRVLWADGSVHHLRAMAIVERNAKGEAVMMIERIGILPTLLNVSMSLPT